MDRHRRRLANINLLIATMTTSRHTFVAPQCRDDDLSRHLSGIYQWPPWHE